MIRKYRCYMLILLLPLLLTSCWDNIDVNKRSIVLSIGVDELNGKIEFTGEIAKLTSGDSESKEKAQVTGSYNFISIGKNFEGSRSDYDAKIPLEDFSGAQRVIVFSKKYAEDGIESYINRLYNTPHFRNSALITVSKEPTREFFSGMVENDISIGYAVENAVRYLSNIGATLYKTVQQINSDICFGDIGYLIPYITKDKNIVEYLGLAAMKNSKLVGIVKREDSSGFLFILSEKYTKTTIFPHPGNDKNLLSVKLNLKKRSIKTSYEDKVINIYIDLNIDSQIQYLYKLEPIRDQDIKKIEDMVSEKIKKDVFSAVERSKNEFKCDVFGFGRYFKSQNSQIFRKMRWQEEYLNADFHVNVKTKITNTNLIDTNAKKQD